MHGLPVLRRPAQGGKDIDYDGLSGPVTFNDAGDPAEATIGVYKYDENNKLTSDVKYQIGKI